MFSDVMCLSSHTYEMSLDVSFAFLWHAVCLKRALVDESKWQGGTQKDGVGNNFGSVLLKDDTQNS